jgi:hypothetical protein
MLVLAVFFCRALSVVQTVSIEGYVPDVFLSGERRLHFRPPSTFCEVDIHVIESSVFQRAPPNSKQVCSFEARLPTDYTLFYNPSQLISPAISISASVPGAFSIARALSDGDFSVAFYDANATFLLRPAGADPPPEYTQIALDDAPFRFLLSQKAEFFVFASSRSQITSRICHPSPRFHRSYLIWLIVSLLIVALVQASVGRPERIGSPAVRCWVVGRSGDVLYGPDTSWVDQNDWESVARCAAEALNRRQTVVSVIRMSRQLSYHNFWRTAAFPAPGERAVVILWFDHLPPSGSETVSPFDSEYRGLAEAPTISFSSFRNFRPLHVSFTLESNIRCVANLPGSVLAAFQPDARAVTTILWMLHNLSDGGSGRTFAEVADECCRRLGVQRGLFFQSPDRMIFQFVSSNLSPIPLADALAVAQDFPISHGFSMSSDMFYGRWFLQRFSAPEFDFMIAIDPGDQCDTFILPFFGLYLVFVFQCSFVKEQAAKAQQIIALIEDLPGVSYIEVSLGRREVLRAHSQLFDPLPTTLSDLSSALHRVSPDVGQIIEDIRHAAAGGGTVAHRLIRTAGENWLNCTVDINYDAFLNDTHCLIFVESLPAEQQAQFERIGGFAGLHAAMSALRVRQFHVINGDIVMDTEQLGTELQRGDIRSLKTFFEPKDLGNYEALLRRHKATFRLQAGSGDLWYSAVSNGESGFIFCIDDLAQSTHQARFDDERQQLAATSAVVVCWAVDSATDKVRSLFRQPTVWDTLSVDRDTPFSRFIDYVEPEDRETFRTNYAQVVRKGVEQWTGEIRIIRMGGTYECHRIIVARSRDSLLHCFPLNIHKQQEMESKLNETRRLRDLLLSFGKLALWRFDDGHQSLDRLKKFEPGLMTVVVMNWHFIDTQVHPAYREAFSISQRAGIES